MTEHIMTEQEVRRIEEESYKTLSPVSAAAGRLQEMLPVDGCSFDNEAWHIFHLKTDDFGTAQRTVRLACELHGRNAHNWKCPTFVSIRQAVKRVEEYCGNPDKSEELARLDEDQKILKAIEEEFHVTANCPLFLYMHHLDIASGGGMGQSDHSASQLSSNIKAYRLMEAVCRCFSKKQAEWSQAQIGNKTAHMDNRAAPEYNRVFFLFYGQVCILPDALRSSLASISYEQLTAEDFRCLLWEYHLRQQRALQSWRKESGRPAGEIAPLEADDSLLQWYADSMAGLEEASVRKILASVTKTSYHDKSAIEDIIIHYKNEFLNQRGRLKVIKVEQKASVFGIDNIHDWLKDHKDSVSLDSVSPSGLLLVGIPGTGKSDTAREAARVLGLPLVQLDMSRILGGRVGDSEKGMREMLEDLQFVAPCVLWIDEIEKAMSGADGKSGDGGTIKRLFGMLLTFIQENKRPVFTVATANDISRLPPEFFRNGRFDQAFCLMMPSYEECANIMLTKLEDCMEKLSWAHKPNKSEAKALLDRCVGTPASPRFLTGADIEAHVRELFWICKRRRMEGEYPAHPPAGGSLPELMAKAAEQVRAQASPSASHTMDDIADRYLDMMRRGLTMAGKGSSPYRQDNLDVDAVRYYVFDEKEAPVSLPLCVKEPDYAVKYREVGKDSQAWTPAQWYDARFFYELNDAMSRRLFLDRENTSEETRREYMKLMRYLRKTKRGGM